jgi:hypothetical protein
LTAIGNLVPVTPMPHSIFVRKRNNGVEGPPELIACDIDSVSLANRLVRRIAKSFRSNGHDPCTGRRWFQMKTTVFHIYRWQQ